ncbi:hypothetical protein VTO73DRAFT_2845 [Trametes versicolor]
MFADLLCSKRPLGGDGRCKLCAPEPCITIMLALVYNTPTPWCISTYVQSHLTCSSPSHTRGVPEPEAPPPPIPDASRPHVSNLIAHTAAFLHPVYNAELVYTLAHLRPVSSRHPLGGRTTATAPTPVFQREY